MNCRTLDYLDVLGIRWHLFKMNLYMKAANAINLIDEQSKIEIISDVMTVATHNKVKAQVEGLPWMYADPSSPTTDFYKVEVKGNSFRVRFSQVKTAHNMITGNASLPIELKLPPEPNWVSGLDETQKEERSKGLQEWFNTVVANYEHRGLRDEDGDIIEKAIRGIEGCRLDGCLPPGNNLNILDFF